MPTLPWSFSLRGLGDAVGDEASDRRRVSVNRVEPLAKGLHIEGGGLVVEIEIEETRPAPLDQMLVDRLEDAPVLEIDLAWAHWPSDGQFELEAGHALVDPIQSPLVELPPILPERAVGPRGKGLEEGQVDAGRESKGQAEQGKLGRQLRRPVFSVIAVLGLVLAAEIDRSLQEARLGQRYGEDPEPHGQGQLRVVRADHGDSA